MNKISISWEYTLDASLPDGTLVDVESMLEDVQPRKDHTEGSWITYLRTTAEYSLTERLLAKLGAKY